MWLLNARTLKVEQYENETEVYGQYAILSHVWQKGEEVSFEDMQQGTGTSKSGYEKIANTCRRALEKHNLAHVWIDTCCINKSSSAELSEAINSMYRWYHEANVCYAYLADVPENKFEQSKWFTRGWTLQELIAPSDIEFYDSEWTYLGNKVSFLYKLATITSIDAEVLRDRQKLTTISVAARMSWASHRHTTRVEDRAYSLMGLFDVNMPMLYGEGPKAFIRLQEEIIRTSTDHSILAWEPWEEDQANILLAPSPYGFRQAGTILSWSHSSIDESFLMSNKGLRITLPALDVNQCVLTHQDKFCAVLNCRYAKHPDQQIALHFHRRPQFHIIPARKADSIVCELSDSPWADGQRTRTNALMRHSLPRAEWLDLTVLLEPPRSEHEAQGLRWTHRISVNVQVPGLQLQEAEPKQNWSSDPHGKTILTQMITADDHRINEG